MPEPVRLLVRALGDPLLHLTGGHGRTVCGLVVDLPAGQARADSAPGCPVCGAVVLPAGLRLVVPGG
jgi:hydrogenase maturation factor